MNPIGIQFTDVPTPCKTLLDVAYTNDCARVPGLLADLKQWLDEDEHNKFLGLDLEYTADGRDVAVIQLAHKKHVMVFQWSSVKHCPELIDFLVNSGIHFASVDITNDKIKMMSTWGIEIPADYHIDLQDLIQFRYPEKTGMADMAAVLIDQEYAGMKKKFPKKQHRFWEKNPLDRINLDYAAIDAYVSFELYRKYSSEDE